MDDGRQKRGVGEAEEHIPTADCLTGQNRPPYWSMTEPSSYSRVPSQRSR